MNPISVERVDWLSDRERLYAVRYEVFVVGQNVPVELEQDALDPSCAHFLALDGERPVGTARVDEEGHIGRVAVLESHRGHGIGTQLMEVSLDFAQSIGLPFALLNAQTSVLDFYLRLGFQPEGVEFMEAGIPHIAMRRPLGDGS